MDDVSRRGGVGRRPSSALMAPSSSVVAGQSPLVAGRRVQDGAALDGDVRLAGERFKDSRGAGWWNERLDPASQPGRRGAVTGLPRLGISVPRHDVVVAGAVRVGTGLRVLVRAVEVLVVVTRPAGSSGTRSGSAGSSASSLVRTAWCALRHLEWAGCASSIGASLPPSGSDSSRGSQGDACPE